MWPSAGRTSQRCSSRRSASLFLVTLVSPTSLGAHFTRVRQLPGDVKIIFEANATKGAQKDLSFKFSQDAAVVWGREVTGRSDSIWDGRAGRVGVVANKPFPIRAAPIKGVADEVTAARQRLDRSRRWAHAMVGTGNGNLVLHVMSLYGISGPSIPAPRYPHFDDNEALLRDA